MRMMLNTKITQSKIKINGGMEKETKEKSNSKEAYGDDEIGD